MKRAEQNNPQHGKEKIIFEIKPSIIPQLISVENIILIIFLAVAMIFGTYIRIGFLEILVILLIGIIVLLPPILRAVPLSRTSYKLTNQHLTIHQKSKKVVPLEIPVSKIRHIRSKRSFVDRILGTGSIFIKTTDQKHEFHMMNVPNCARIERRIHRAAKI
jgi:membrane protein YdbS with pleckstrin-like domain